MLYLINPNGMDVETKDIKRRLSHSIRLKFHFTAFFFSASIQLLWCDQKVYMCTHLFYVSCLFHVSEVLNVVILTMNDIHRLKMLQVLTFNHLRAKFRWLYWTLFWMSFFFFIIFNLRTMPPSNMPLVFQLKTKRLHIMQNIFSHFIRRLLVLCVWKLIHTVNS